MTYTLTVTEEQVRIIRDACELLARLRMAQFDAIHHIALPDMPTEHLPEFREHAWALEAELANEYHTPHDQTGVREAAWDLYQVTRHRLAHDRLKPGEQPDYTVQFSTPRLTGREPLARIEQVTE
jgi:hypothetical protein